MPSESWIDHRLPNEKLREIAYSCTLEQAKAAFYNWPLWARKEQLPPPGDWASWVILAGRGFGKTRSGAEAVKAEESKGNQRIAIVGPTSADCRNVLVEGESGLLSCYSNDDRPLYQPSRRQIQFRSGSVAFLYSAEEPDRLRGPQHSWAWVDEFAAYPDPEGLWNNLKFGLRLGADPRVLVTTTPKPLKQLQKILAQSGTVVTRGSTFDNAANLPEVVLQEFRNVYSGTRIGRQELWGELLEDIEGALWLRSNIDQHRVRVAPELDLIVIAIDPAVTAKETSDETGIIAAGKGVDGHCYILRDLSCRLPAAQWARRAVSCFDDLEANLVVAEVNNGGDLVESVLRTERESLPYKDVRASRGKVTRAEPVAALYEQGKVHHVGEFDALEDEQCAFVPGALSVSPNRADACVWAVSHLMLKPEKVGFVEWLS